MHKTRNGNKRSVVFTKGKNAVAKKRIRTDTKSKVTKKAAPVPVVNVIPPPIFPLLRTSDLDENVPIFSSLLSQDSISMDDLNPLQGDLEKLLSTCELRKRLLVEKLESMKRLQRSKKNQKSQLCSFDINKQQQQLTVKQKKVECKGKGKGRKMKNGPLPTRSQDPVINDTVITPSIKPFESPKVALAKNDASDKFWLSAEPFCAEITPDDIAFLDDLIHESSEIDEVIIPPIDGHYAQKWNNEMVDQQKNYCNSSKIKSKNAGVKNKMESIDFNKLIDTFTSPLSQRLFESFVDQNIQMEAVNETMKKKKNLSKLKKRSCMYKRLQEDLVAEGLLKMEDMVMEQDDEILREIKRCVQELSVVKEQNVTELTKLKIIATRSIQRQKIKESLEEVDKKVLEMYNKILANKRNPLVMNNPNNIIQGYEEEANELINKQLILQNRLIQFDDEDDDDIH